MLSLPTQGFARGIPSSGLLLAIHGSVQMVDPVPEGEDCPSIDGIRQCRVYTEDGFHLSDSGGSSDRIGD